jgi:hypothetical protein
MMVFFSSDEPVARRLCTQRKVRGQAVANTGSYFYSISVPRVQTPSMMLNKCLSALIAIGTGTES